LYSIIARAIVKTDELGLPAPKHPLNFVMLFSHRLPRKHPFKGVIDKNFKVPILYSFDKEDNTEPTFETVYDTEGDSTIINHDEDHKIPLFIDEEMEKLAQFLDEQYSDKFGKKMKLNHKIDIKFRDNFKKLQIEKPKLSKL